MCFDLCTENKRQFRDLSGSWRISWKAFKIDIHLCDWQHCSLYADKNPRIPRTTFLWHLNFLCRCLRCRNSCQILPPNIFFFLLARVMWNLCHGREILFHTHTHLHIEWDRLETRGLGHEKQDFLGGFPSWSSLTYLTHLRHLLLPATYISLLGFVAPECTMNKHYRAFREERIA